MPRSKIDWLEWNSVADNLRLIRSLIRSLPKKIFGQPTEVVFAERLFTLGWNAVELFGTWSGDIAADEEH